MNYVKMVWKEGAGEMSQADFERLETLWKRAVVLLNDVPPWKRALAPQLYRDAVEFLNLVGKSLGKVR